MLIAVGASGKLVIWRVQFLQRVYVANNNLANLRITCLCRFLFPVNCNHFINVQGLSTEINVEQHFVVLTSFTHQQAIF